MKRGLATVVLIPVAVLCLPANVVARGVDATKLDTPKIFQDVIDCHAIADSQQRLACYDAKVEALAKAKDARDIVVADKAEVKEARRGLFGFRLPTLRIFGGGDASEDDEIKQIDGVVESARQVGYGAWQFTLKDAGTWVQTDTETVVFGPRSGSKVTIKRGALGSYKANIDGQPGIKVRRVE